MSARNPRRITRIVLVAVLLLSGTMVCAADSGAPDAADRPWANRPLPNLLTPVWSATVANLDVASYQSDFMRPPEASFTSTAAVLPGLTNIEIRDPRTGRMLHDIQVGEMVGDVAIADGVIVAQTRADDGFPSAFRMLRAYDLSSGRELWSDTLFSRHILETGRHASPAATVVTSRGVVVSTRGGEMIGLDLRTGATRWGIGAACSLTTLSATENMVVGRCTKGPPVMVDPANGRAYEVKVPGYVMDIATTPGAVGIEWTTADLFASEKPDPIPQETMVVSETMYLLGRIDGSPGRLVQVLGGQAILEDHGEVRAVSLARGTELWRRTEETRIWPSGDISGSEAGAVSADGLVLLNAIGEGAAPGMTLLLEPSGRITPPLPWPVFGRFAGAIPGYVFVVSHAAHQYRFTALRLDRERPPSARLGAAARPSDWPDPCRLLTAGQLATLGPGYTAFPAKRPESADILRLPYSSQCNFAGRHPFALRIGWVAADRAGAEALTQSLLPGPERVGQAGPGGYLYTNESLDPVPGTDGALVARGRFVIDVDAPGQVDLAAKVARLLQADRPPDPAGALDRAAVEKTVRDHGFIPVIQMSPPAPGPLRAVYAGCGPAQCGQVFLFLGARLVGAPPGASAGRPYYQDVQIVRQDGNAVRLATAVVPPGAPCCQIPHDMIDLQMSGGRLMYRVESGPWRPAPAAPTRRG